MVIGRGSGSAVAIEAGAGFVVAGDVAGAVVAICPASGAAADPPQAAAPMRARTANEISWRCLRGML
jgi:hypothetical protein